MILSMQKRFDDNETNDEVFSDLKSELHEIKLIEKLWLIITELYTEIIVRLSKDWEMFMKELIEKSITHPRYGGIKF